MEDFCFESDIKDVKKVKLEESNDVKNVSTVGEESKGKQQCLVCNQYFSHFELEIHYLECLLDDPNQTLSSPTVDVNQPTSTIPPQSFLGVSIPSDTFQPSTAQIDPRPKVNVDHLRSNILHPIQRNSIPSDTIQPTINNGARIYNCVICMNRCSDPLSFKKHLSFHNLVQIGQYFPQNASDSQPNSSAIYKCLICKKILNDHQTIQNHVKLHENQKTDQQWNQSGTIQNHASQSDNSTSNIGKPYSCGTCSKRFRSVTGYRGHIRKKCGVNFRSDLNRITANQNVISSKNQTQIISNKQKCSLRSFRKPMKLHKLKQSLKKQLSSQSEFNQVKPHQNETPQLSTLASQIEPKIPEQIDTNLSDATNEMLYPSTSDQKTDGAKEPSKDCIIVATEDK